MQTQNDPVTIGRPTERKMEEVRNIDYDLPIFHPGQSWNEIKERISVGNIDPKFAKLMLPLPKGEVVEGEFLRLGGKDESRYVVLRDTNKAEFRIWCSGQLNYKLNNDLKLGDYIRITYLGKSEESIDIVDEKGKTIKVKPHNYKVEVDRTPTSH